MARVTIHPREAAALDRLLDAYLHTDEDDPGLPDLRALRERVRQIEHDHAAYDRVVPVATGRLR